MEWKNIYTIDEVGMSEKEAIKAEHYVKGKTKMLEWGSGGTTLYFPQMIDKYVSIEHDKKWYDIIKSKIHKNVEFYHVPTETTTYSEDDSFIIELETKAFDILEGNKNWYENHGVKEISKTDDKIYWTTRGRIDWHMGIDYIKKPLDLEHRDYDVVLVDGRCRAMCAYTTQYLLNDDGYLLFHDFNHREYYHGILKYYEIVDTEESLAILQKIKK